MPSGGAETAERAEASGTESTWDKHKEAFTQKRTSKYHDPCQEFANKSIRCMNRNNGDREMCSDFFQAYRDCKKEWTNAMRGVDTTKKGWWAQRWNS